MTSMAEVRPLRNLESRYDGAPANRASPPPLPELKAKAVLFDGRETAALGELALETPGEGDLVIDVEWTGISTGTERLMWSGDMPMFPGMGYPLVPGYEAVGTVIWAHDRADLLGERVFVPGARCFQGANGLFGAAASRLVAPASRAALVSFDPPEEAILLALAATAAHAIEGGAPPDLIVGHGVLGRLLARLALAMGAPTPVVWEIDPERADADGYPVLEPEFDGRTDYKSVYDASGDSQILDQLIARLAPKGEIVLAGFYSERPSFNFPAAFMREARFRIAAEWRPEDMSGVLRMIRSGKLSLDGLITHRLDAREADGAYRTAFDEPECLKMVLDWKRMHGHVV